MQDVRIVSCNSPPFDWFLHRSLVGDRHTQVSLMLIFSLCAAETNTCKYLPETDCTTWQQCKSMFVATVTTTNLTLRNPRQSCSVRKGQISALTHFLKRSDVKLDITACHPLLYLSFDRILYKFFIIIIFLDWYSFCQFTSLLCERCCKFVLENFAFCK